MPSMNKESVSAMLIACGFSVDTIRKIFELRELHGCLMEKTKNEIVALQRKAILKGYNCGDMRIFRGFRTEIDPEKGRIEYFPIFIKKEGEINEH